MTEPEWIDKVKSNKELLTNFIKDWHPTNINRKPSMRITAPNVEAAIHSVRASIRNQLESANPIAKFELALAQSDIQGINNILNETWFGVPESTDCWQIPGFREAVELIEDVPYEE